MSDEITPAELVRRIHHGDAAAEALLVSKYSRSMFYVLKRRCGDSELARDICQDTLIVLLKKLRAQPLDEPDKLSSYIHRTALNLLTASQRKDARRQTSPDSEQVSLHVDDSSNPLNDVERMQIRRSVKDSILSLNNSRDKEILYRYYISEHDKEDICAHLDIDFRHFDKVIFRAKTRLKQTLQDTNGEEMA